MKKAKVDWGEALKIAHPLAHKREACDCGFLLFYWQKN